MELGPLRTSTSCTLFNCVFTELPTTRIPSTSNTAGAEEAPDGVVLVKAVKALRGDARSVSKRGDQVIRTLPLDHLA
jgi:hypothetical protein